MLRTILVSLESLFLLYAACALTEEKTSMQQTNFLFIIYDDLRPELSIYGKYGIISPNFERLAAKSVRFDSFCQIAVCNPSRDEPLIMDIL